MSADVCVVAFFVGVYHDFAASAVHDFDHRCELVDDVVYGYVVGVVPVFDVDRRGHIEFFVGDGVHEIVSLQVARGVESEEVVCADLDARA